MLTDKIKGEIAEDIMSTDDSKGETTKAKSKKKVSSKGGISIAEEISRDDEGGIARRGIVTKGQLAKTEVMTESEEGQLTRHTLGSGAHTVRKGTRNRRRGGLVTKRGNLAGESRTAEEDVVCILSVTHYLVDGAIGGRAGEMSTSQFAFDTWAGSNLICQSALPPGREKLVDRKASPPRVKDASGRPLDLGESVWIPVRLANTLYREKFTIASRLVVEVIIDTEFLNGHVLAILCTEQRIRFRSGEVPIVRQLTRDREEGEKQNPFASQNWTQERTREVKTEGRPPEGKENT